MFPPSRLGMINSIYGVQEDDDVLKMRINAKSLFEKKDVEPLYEPVLKALKKHGPMTMVQVKKHIDEKLVKTVVRNKWENESNLQVALLSLWYMGKLENGAVDIKQVKSWVEQHRKYRISTFKFERVPFDDAMEELCRWYIETYGTVSINDWIWWTGLPGKNCQFILVGQSRGVFEKISKNCIEIAVDDIEYPLFIDKKHYDLLEKTLDEEFNSIRILPYEDSLIKGYNETRWRFFDEDMGKKIIISGVLTNTVWVNGNPVGAFTQNNKEKLFTMTLFDEKYKSVIKEECDLLVKFSGFQEMTYSSPSKTKTKKSSKKMKKSTVSSSESQESD